MIVGMRTLKYFGSARVDGGASLSEPADVESIVDREYLSCLIQARFMEITMHLGLKFRSSNGML